MSASVQTLPTVGTSNNSNRTAKAVSGDSSTNLYKMTPRQTTKAVERIMKAGRVAFIRSSPGMGKSSIVRSIADDWNLKLIDHRCSTSAPEDFTGLPRFSDDGKAYFAPFEELFPLENTPLPDGKDGWLLFLDEFNSAHRDVQAAAYKLILDHMTGQHKLHERVLIVCAGNLGTDKAIVNELSTAMKSRMIHIEMEINHSDWLEDVAFAQGYDERVIAYLNYRPNSLMNFDPDSEESTFCCPRTWEFINDILRVTGGALKDEDAALLAGTISPGIAVDFLQFCRVYGSMITIDQIRQNPNNAPIPKDNPTKYAVTCHMMDKVDDANFDDLATYINRFDMTFKILFFRSVMVRNPGLRSRPAFTKAMVDLNKYLRGN